MGVGSRTTTVGASLRARPSGRIGPVVAGAASLGDVAGRAGALVSGKALTLQQESAGRSMDSHTSGQQGSAARRGTATGKPANKTSTVTDTNFATLPHLIG